MKVGISAMEYYLPEKVIDNDFFEHSKNEFLEEKVGIKERRIAAKDEATSDMCVTVINNLLNKNKIDRNEIEFMILCTLSPDYPIPQTSSQVQHYCELPKSLYAVDVRLGCSGFVYSLSMAEALIRGFGFKKGLVVTADKFSMYLSYRDYTVDTLFSDNASAVLVEENPKLLEITAHDFGTDGSGTEQICVKTGGSRYPRKDASSPFQLVKPGIERSDDYLYMNGRQVMKFANATVAPSAERVMQRAGITLDDVDWVIMHQANKLMLEDIAKRMQLPPEKNYINLWNKGNTTASSVAIATKEVLDRGERLNHGRYWIITGFGVGYSWGTTALKYVG
ncbi:MAG: ketoacyl-ACP synthase III [Oligoflexia bacterium]|nr:ketoacyl-ACP synthase III [Oligoflexia bacterium]